MRYLKFTADEVFDGYHFLPAGTVVITDDDGVITDIVDSENAGDDIQRFNGILSPGLINCHCHLELSHLKGIIPPGTGLVDFVLAVVQQRHLPDQIILEAIEQAESEMLRNGIAAVGDICNNTLTIPQKQKGNIVYHNFIEASGFHPSIAEDRFQKSVSYFMEYAAVGPSSITPHAPYSVSDPLWELILQFPGNGLLSIHNQESQAENEWFLNKEGGFAGLYKRMGIDAGFFLPSGKTSLQSYLPKIRNDRSLILVHNVFTKEDDISFAKKANTNLFWCLCPNANEYITGTLPPVDLLMQNNCTIVLGTDSLASNHQLSIMEEINTLRKSFPHVKTEILLQWATSSGATALGMDTNLGSFERGKKPGVVLVDSELTVAKRIL